MTRRLDTVVFGATGYTGRLLNGPHDIRLVFAPNSLPGRGGDLPAVPDGRASIFIAIQKELLLLGNEEDQVPLPALNDFDDHRRQPLGHRHARSR